MKEPEFDGEGYPTDETLEAIENWSIRDINGCLDFVKSAWHWPEYASHELSFAEKEVCNSDDDDGDKHLRLATGGWSGNESLVAALEHNVVIAAMCWRLSAVGGLHIYRYWK